MQTKTTRAFRTISEAGDELGLQPHVLRFWESKFPQIKPIKRGGGRRFYRPEDIEFLRGIKKLLHDENHPIKDVQKLIRVKGANRVIELGRSVEKAAREKDITETVLVPERIQKTNNKPKKPSIFSVGKLKPSAPPKPEPAAEPEPMPLPDPIVQVVTPTETTDNIVAMEPARGLTKAERDELELALQRLIDLRSRWQDFRQKVAAAD